MRRAAEDVAAHSTGFGNADDDDDDDGGHDPMRPRSRTEEMYRYDIEVTGSGNLTLKKGNILIVLITHESAPQTCCPSLAEMFLVHPHTHHRGQPQVWRSLTQGSRGVFIVGTSAIPEKSPNRPLGIIRGCQHIHCAQIQSWIWPGAAYTVPGSTIC